MTPTSRMSTVSMATAVSPSSGTNIQTKSPPAGDGGKETKDANDQTTISVAASAASLILVLVAIVIWYFLVRKQLLSKTKSHQRLGSHKSHRSNPGSRQGSFRDGHSGSIRDHHSSRHSPKSHRSSSSPKSHHRHSGCHDNKEICTCRKSYDAPLVEPQSPKNTSMSECTGNSPFCPHSTRFQHPNHQRTRDSVHSELSDTACGPAGSICTCNMEQGQTKVITGAEFTVVELEAHNKRQMESKDMRNGHATPFSLRDVPSTSAQQQPFPILQCTCPHPPASPPPDSPLAAGHRKVTHVQSDPGVIGQRGDGEMV
ncbi:uncharacterized protein [Diadema antillarum]|uniref:uncharacterized protein n=1 Tax=Diadema antillarum TaxID=105358 RepID=UPI003A8A54E4